MNKTVHLISNAHLDPVWQWEWEEGAAAAISTFRCAADFCDEYGDYVFCHNEALLYRWIEEYEPSLFERIRVLVKKGQWKIMGGWYLQPDCNMPSGEGFVRQILEGRKYFAEKFGVRPTTAINFDPFGHTRGLVQIMAKAGYDSYVFMRPTEMQVPARVFTWKGFDGSEITAVKCSAYGTSLGDAVKKIREDIDGCPDEVVISLWGVGDHGGGASRKDIEEIDGLIRDYAEQGVAVRHSSVEDFFADVKASGKELPVFEDQLNPWAVGCYTSQVRIKQRYRRIENELFTAEKMCVAAETAGLMDYPEKELLEAAYDMITVQFHDMLPGSSVQNAEEMALRMLDHGIEILTRVKFRAFSRLTAGLPKAPADRIPVLVFNPYPYPVETDVDSEMMLWNQNWTGTFSMPQAYSGGRPLPTQCEKEASSINLDWRKRAVFRATLAPMQMNYFDVGYTQIAEKPVPDQGSDPDRYVFRGAKLSAVLNKQTGLIDSLVVGDKEFSAGNLFGLEIYRDDEDPWGMCVEAFPEKIGEFSLLSPEEGSIFSGVKRRDLPSVRIVEDGPVRTVAEALFGFRSSKAVITYTFSKFSDVLGVHVRISWGEKQLLVKMRVNTTLCPTETLGETAYGEQPVVTGTRENCVQRYMLMHDGQYALSLANDGVYGASCEGGTYRQTLLRSAAYTAHPLGDRERIPQNRFTPHIEQGERLFAFTVTAGKEGDVRKNAARNAALLNAKPMTVSYFPLGDGVKAASPLTLSGDTVEAVAFKKATDKNGYILRLFNPCREDKAVTLQSPLLALPHEETVKPMEIVTLRLSGGKAFRTGLDETDF